MAKNGKKLLKNGPKIRLSTDFPMFRPFFSHFPGVPKIHVRAFFFFSISGLVARNGSVPAQRDVNTKVSTFIPLSLPATFALTLALKSLCLSCNLQPQFGKHHLTGWPRFRFRSITVNSHMERFERFRFSSVPTVRLGKGFLCIGDL